MHTTNLLNTITKMHLYNGRIRIVIFPVTIYKLPYSNCPSLNRLLLHLLGFSRSTPPSSSRSIFSPCGLGSGRGRKVQVDELVPIGMQVQVGDSVPDRVVSSFICSFVHSFSRRLFVCSGVRDSVPDRVARRPRRSSTPGRALRMAPFPRRSRR